MKDAKIPLQTPSVLLALAALQGGVNLSLLMPAASHPHAGVFTQALPYGVAVLTVALFVLALLSIRNRRT